MSMARDTVTVIGTGGIGGTFAGFLTLAGERVVVVDRMADHVQAMRQEGLLIEDAEGARRVRLAGAVEPEELDGPLGTVLLAVKSQHTEDALALIRPRLRDDGTVVPLQNGLNALRLAEDLGPRRVVGAMVHLVANHLGPGHIRRFTEGEIVIGELDGTLGPRVRALAARLSTAVPTTAHANVMGVIWSKLVYCCLLCTTALVDAPSSDVLRPAWVRRLLVGIMGEAVRVAQADGITLEPYDRVDPAILLPRTPAELAQACATLPHGSAKGASGMYYDLKVRHRKTETDFLTGEVVRRGRRHGVPVPLNERVWSLMSEVESGRRAMSWDNLHELEPLGATLPPLPEGEAG